MTALVTRHRWAGVYRTRGLWNVTTLGWWTWQTVPADRIETVRSVLGMPQDLFPAFAAVIADMFRRATT